MKYECSLIQADTWVKYHSGCGEHIYEYCAVTVLKTNLFFYVSFLVAIKVKLEPFFKRVQKNSDWKHNWVLQFWETTLRRNVEAMGFMRGAMGAMGVMMRAMGAMTRARGAMGWSLKLKEKTEQFSEPLIAFGPQVLDL